MDITTLALAVDSTQVTSAADALNKMAVAGGAAEDQTTALTKAASEQSKILGGALQDGAKKATLGFKDLAAAQASLGPAAAKQLAEAIAKLNDTDAEARAAAASLTAMGDAGATAGAKVTAALSAAGGGSGVIPPSVGGTTSTPAPGPQKPSSSLPLNAGQTEFLATLQAQAAAAGKTKVELLSMQAAQLGVGTQAKGLIDQITKASAATHEFGFQTAGAKRELLVLGHELATGNFSRFGTSLLVLGERTGAAAALFSPLALGIGAVVAAVGALAIAFEEGAAQSKAFADSLVNTGNFAGQTEGQFNASAKAIASSTNQSVGSIRELQQALISTGQIGPQVFAQATAAAVAYSKATGKSADEVAKDFAKLAEAPAKFAISANQSLNFLTAAQVQTIKGFEDTGRAADAQGVIFDALAARNVKLEQNLGELGGTLHQLAIGFKNFWDSALDIGRTETPEEKIAQLRARLANQAPLATTQSLLEAGETPGLALSSPDLTPKQRQQTLAQIDNTERDQQQKAQTAFLQATSAETQKAGIAARTFGESQLAAAKDVSALNKALGENKVAFDNAAKAGVPFSAAQQKTIDDNTRKRFTPTSSKVSARFDKADLDADLKVFRDHLQAQQDALTLADRLLAGEYRAGNISLQQFYSDRNAIDAQGLADKIAELDKERARIQQSIDKDKDPAQKRQDQSKFDEAGAQQDRLRLKFAGDQKLANQEEAAAFKALTNEVTNYRANLLLLAGDESGAAALRTAQAIKQAQELATKAGTTVRTAGDVARLDHNIESGNDLQSQVAQEAQLRLQLDAINNSKNKSSQINSILTIQEDRIALAQKNGSITELDALQAVGDARKASLAGLEEQVKEQERIAALPENALNFKIQLDVAEARLNIEKLKSDLDPLKKKFDDLFTGAGTSALADLLNGTKSFKAAATDFLKSISTGISNTIAQNASESFFGAKGPGAGAGGFVADLFRGGKKADTTGAKPVVDTSSITASFSTLQTTGVDPLADALVRLTQAANGTTTALGQPQGAGLLAVDKTGEGIDAAGHGFSAAKDGQTGEQSITDLFKDADTAQAKSAQSTDAFGKNAATAAVDILRLADSAGKGNSALGLLPSIIALIQSSATGSAASSAGGAGGGIIGSIAGLFGGSKTGGIDAAGHGFNAGADSAAADVAPAVDDFASLFFHSGGMVGEGTDRRPIDPSVFADASKYHSGGPVIGSKEIPGLKHDEVPAILLKNEEVLTAKDPRHRDNIAPALLKSIEDGQGQPTNILSVVAGSNTKAPQDSPIGSVARMLGHEKQTRELSPLTKYLIGSPATVSSLITELSKESDFQSVTALRDIKHVVGAREWGGPVASNSAYRVNERGPELLEVAGKQYLMTGNQGGNVQAAEQPAQRAVNVSINQSFAAGTSRQTTDQAAAQAARAAARALGRGAA